MKLTTWLVTCSVLFIFGWKLAAYVYGFCQSQLALCSMCKQITVLSFSQHFVGLNKNQLCFDLQFNRCTSALLLLSLKIMLQLLVLHSFQDNMVQLLLFFYYFLRKKYVKRVHHSTSTRVKWQVQYLSSIELLKNCRKCKRMKSLYRLTLNQQLQVAIVANKYVTLNLI